jgi:hypothetical protein
MYQCDMMTKYNRSTSIVQENNIFIQIQLPIDGAQRNIYSEGL